MRYALNSDPRQRCVLRVTAFLFLFAVASIPTPAQVRTSTILVQDISEPGSPMVVSGTVRLTESISGNTIRVSIADDIVGRNISDKIILTLVARIEVEPSQGSRQEFVRQYECFFAPDVIRPGDQHSLSGPGPTETTETFNPLHPPKTARATAKIVYVQYVDGSTFGHPVFGAEIRKIRQITWQHLRRLDRAYQRGGLSAFQEELSETVQPQETETVLEGIRQTVRSRGALAGISQVRKMLSLAEQYRAGFTHEANP